VLSSPEYQAEAGKGSLEVRWINRDNNTVQLQSSGNMGVKELIELHGKIPLPPYIKRQPEITDRERYQTVFGKNDGAVAAPTASLHFTDQLVKAIQDNGVQLAYLTLHVGLGTFKPVTAEYSNEHDMHGESFVITEKFLTSVISHLNGRITAAGTTALRLLESLYYIGGAILLNRDEPLRVHSDAGFDPELNAVDLHDALAALNEAIKENGGELRGETSIFIVPGFKFKVANALITNFHQPGSTLLMLVAAFVGETWKGLYRWALDSDYRFLSYGDGSLLFRE
jgi:S-adenosylmethionine:tRNA ribosyltransferase-isomerase